MVLDNEEDRKILLDILNVINVKGISGATQIVNLHERIVNASVYTEDKVEGK